MENQKQQTRLTVSLMWENKKLKLKRRKKKPVKEPEYNIFN